MKNFLFYIILTFLLFTVLSIAQSPSEKHSSIPCNYFPINNNITLVYKSSFGESITKYLQIGLLTTSSSEADNFKYRQIMIIKNDGVYVRETYQYLKILLFIKKENTYTYEKPLLRFPLPLVPGMEWKWEGDEYCDGDTSRVKVTGKVVGKELVVTGAGTFETVKLESIIEGTGNSKNIVTEWFSDGIGLVKAKIIIEGGGVMGFMRDLLGYGTIEFELKEIKAAKE